MTHVEFYPVENTINICLKTNQVLAPVILNSFQDLFIKLNYN